MTEELKKAIEAAKTDEEKKTITEKFKEELMSLSEDELNSVAGGGFIIKYTCAKCKQFGPALPVEEDSNGNLIHRGCGGTVSYIYTPATAFLPS